MTNTALKLGIFPVTKCKVHLCNAVQTANSFKGNLPESMGLSHAGQRGSVNEPGFSAGQLIGLWEAREMLCVVQLTEQWLESHSALQPVHTVKLLQGTETAQEEVLGGLWAGLLPAGEGKAQQVLSEQGRAPGAAGEAAAPPASPQPDCGCPAVQEGSLTHR